MNKLKFIFSVTLFLVGLICPTFSFAQDDNNRAESSTSYEVVLQILTASNNPADKAVVPQSLSNVVKKLRTNYSFSNYHLTSTYLQRIANSGNIEFKSVSNETLKNQQPYAPIFTEWSMGQLINLPNSKENSIQFRSFRFGQRIPIVIENSKTEGGNSSSNVIYEQIGLSIQKLNVSENVPTVIGTLSTSKAEELMFLILSVKSAE